MHTRRLEALTASLRKMGEGGLVHMPTYPTRTWIRIMNNRFWMGFWAALALVGLIMLAGSTVLALAFNSKDLLAGVVMGVPLMIFSAGKASRRLDRYGRLLCGQPL